MKTKKPTKKKRKKRKGKKAELEEGDKDASDRMRTPLRNKDKDQGQMMVVEKGKEVVVRVLEELGLGEYHNNFNFISTLGALGMWIAKNYDPEEHTIKMVDGRKIKVTRELIHDILGVPMGEREVNALLNTTKLLKKRQVEELKNGGFGQLPNLGNLGSREDELEQFKSKTLQDMKDCLNDNLSKIKALLLDTDDKLKIALDENPEDSDLKMILGKRLGFFKELCHRDVDNAMVVFDKGNDVPEEAVKDNEVSKEKDDVPEKEKDDVPEKEKDDFPEKEKDVAKMVERGGKKQFR
ncbi:hypothetical protein Tco_0167732 [Tanacetum coccineum]